MTIDLKTTRISLEGLLSDKDIVAIVKTALESNGKLIYMPGTSELFAQKLIERGVSPEVIAEYFKKLETSPFLALVGLSNGMNMAQFDIDAFSDNILANMALNYKISIKALSKAGYSEIDIIGAAIQSSAGLSPRIASDLISKIILSEGLTENPALPKGMTICNALDTLTLSIARYMRASVYFSEIGCLEKEEARKVKEKPFWLQGKLKVKDDAAYVNLAHERAYYGTLCIVLSEGKLESCAYVGKYPVSHEGQKSVKKPSIVQLSAQRTDSLASEIAAIRAQSGFHPDDFKNDNPLFTRTDTCLNYSFFALDRIVPIIYSIPTPTAEKIAQEQFNRRAK